MMRPEEHPVDRAVREHLEREASKVDARALLASIRAQPHEPMPLHVRTLTRRAWLRGATLGTGGAVAAGLALYFLFPGAGPGPDVKMLSAAELIQESITAHESEKTDRLYDVHADWEATPFQRRFPFRPIAKQAKLWTRGDQFYVEASFADGLPVKWGQEKSGRVWIVPRPDRVLLYEPDDLAEPLARFCEMMSLRLVSTLADLLVHYELKREESQANEPIRIAANLRGNPNHSLPRISRVEIDLDPKTKFVKRAVLTRSVSGETLGSIAFNLLETTAIDEKRYEYRSHCSRNPLILDGPRPPLGPPPFPRFDPRNDPRAKFREDWLKNWPAKG